MAVTSAALGLAVPAQAPPAAATSAPAPVAGLSVSGTALAAAEATDGLVDPTLGCHLADVGYDRDFTSLPADGPAVAPGCALDLGATAKARGADRAAARIRAELGTGVLVPLGGDVAAAGAMPADGWPVHVAVSSRAERGSDETVLLTGGGLATSSPGARRWRRGGREQHHILDPPDAPTGRGHLGGGLRGGAHVRGRQHRRNGRGGLRLTRTALAATGMLTVTVLLGIAAGSRSASAGPGS